MNCKGSGGATEFDALTVEVTFKFYNLRTGDAPAPDKGEGDQSSLSRVAINTLYYPGLASSLWIGEASVPSPA